MKNRALVSLITVLFVTGLVAYERISDRSVSPEMENYLTLIEDSYMAKYNAEYGFVGDHEKNKLEQQEVPTISYFLFRSDAAKTCVFGAPPNQVLKQTISSFYELLVEELVNTPTGEAYSYPVYVKNISDCGLDTDIYIYLVLDHYHQSNVNNQWDALLERHNLPSSEEPGKFEDGAVYFYIDENHKIKSLVSINQIKDDNLSIEEKRYVTLVALEELFHALTIGRDNLGEATLQSIIHEPIYLIEDERGPGRGTINRSHFLEYQASGLCTLDLWHLLFAYSGKSNFPPPGTKRFMGHFMEYYSRLFKTDFNRVKSSATEIQNNPRYKGIFDPRCGLDTPGSLATIPVYHKGDWGKFDEK